VVAHASANAAILVVADLTSSVVNFNGDDAFELKYNGVTVDVIGQIGFDPGAAWGAEPTTTVNHTLTRLVTVCCGDPDGSNAFDPAAEWTAFATDTFTELGTHLTDCLAVPNEGASWGGVKSRFR
jgi:predicted extracellular nuclease